MPHKLKFSFMDLQLMYYRVDDNSGKPKYIIIYYYVR
jgi:hypothetical protein